MIKYSLKTDYTFVLKYKKKYLIWYFCIILVFILFQKKFNLINVNDLYLDSLGLDASFDKNFISILLFLYHNILIIYFQFLLFTKDLKNGPDNLFLRVKLKKWYFIKILSITIFTVVLKFILHVFVTALFYFVYENFEIGIYLCFKYFIILLIYTIIIQNILMFLYFLKNTKLKFTLLFILTFYAILKNIPLSVIISIRNIKLSLIILCVLFISNTVLFSKNYLSVFEKEV